MFRPCSPRPFAALAVLVGALALRAVPAQGAAAVVPPPFVRWCAECHAGADPEKGFDVEVLFAPNARDATDFDARLELAVRRVRGRTMPPPDEVEPPSDEERRALVVGLAELAPHRPGARIAVMRRLTRRHYERSIEALFGIRWQARDLLPDDATVHGFEGIGDVQNVSPLMFEKYFDAALDVATAVLADEAARVRTFGAGDLADALPTLLRSAYRRGVDADEVQAQLGDFAAMRARGLTVEAARSALLRAILTSPSFLFRVEIGRPEDPAELTAHELAVRLAFMLTSGPPDAELAATADDGSLVRREVLAAQALRLAQLRDGRALAEDFAVQWLGLAEVLTHAVDFRRFPQIWNKSLRPSLHEEAIRLFAGIVGEDRSVLELLDADYAFVDRDLAAHYGLPAPEGDGFRRVALPDRRRGGILGAGAMLMATSLALRTSPVKRGQWILTRLLDSPPPPPPADAGTLPKDDVNDAGLTLREQLERHRRERRCAACHTEMDAFGLALENYDPIGRWRDEVHGKQVDASTELPDGAAIAGPVALKDLLLARSDDFVRTLAKNLLVYGVGRDLLLRDEPELARIVATTRAGGDHFSTLLTAVVTSPLFVLRDPDRMP
ncbi:MAG: DUF1592 domain-containing protein [Planctomycetes bacterium]|nr:DUF1592 domain-containing protein [Planctomycetota bacterium]